MKKIRLDLDALAVDTFEPAARKDAGRGTVRAHAETEWGEHTCDDFGSCFRRCIGSVFGAPC
jgi:hypothetical protein